MTWIFVSLSLTRLGECAECASLLPDCLSFCKDLLSRRRQQDPDRKKEDRGDMGRLFLQHLGGDRVYSCRSCGTFLTNRDQMISERFTGSTGKAMLFNKVVNLSFSEIEERNMLTGMHKVRDVFCKSCHTRIGWFYEYAVDEPQRYKEGKTILEKALISLSDAFPQQHHQQHHQHHQHQHIPPSAAALAAPAAGAGSGAIRRRTTASRSIHVTAAAALAATAIVSPSAAAASAAGSRLPLASPPYSLSSGSSPSAASGSSSASSSPTHSIGTSTSPHLMST